MILLMETICQEKVSLIAYLLNCFLYGWGGAQKKFSLVSVLKLQFSTFKLDPLEKGFRQNTDLWQKTSKFNTRNGFIAHQL